MGPQNYTLGSVVDPGLAFSQGLQSGQQQAVQQQQQAIAIQQQQAALQAQQRRDQALQRVLSNPRAGAQGYAELMLLMPRESEAIKRSWETLNTQQSAARLSDLTQWTAAIEAGRPEFAVSAMLSQADAVDAEAGKPTPEGQALRAQADIVKADPTTAARVLLKPLLFAHPDGGKVLDNIGKQGTEQRAAATFPAELRAKEAGATKAEADATTAQVTAKYADRQALADLETKGWNIQAIQNDIEYKKQANRIAAMQAQTARLNSDTQRQELGLKIQEAQGKLADKVREKVATAEAGAANIDNMLNTIERIKKNPSLNSVIGSMEGSDFYPSVALGTVNPLGNGDERADAIALIETLGSQAFLAQIPNIKGMGALSNAEGEKLQSALQNLSRKQSEGQFRANLNEAARLLTKGREMLSKSTGVPLGKPDTPAAPGARPPLESFFK